MQNSAILLRAPSGIGRSLWSDAHPLGAAALVTLREIVLGYLLAVACALALAVLTLSGHINIQEIIWLSAFQGAINAFDMPGRQAFMVQMVEDRQDLGNAIALNSSMVNMARLVGPSLAGGIIALFGTGYCFLIDGLSYLAVIASLLMMRLVPFGTSKGTRR